MRPQIVGEALQAIAEDPEVLEAVFEVLETEGILAGPNRLTLIPAKSGGLAPGLAALGTQTARNPVSLQ
jgi:hypothetical protein